MLEVQSVQEKGTEETPVGIQKVTDAQVQASRKEQLMLLREFLLTKKVEGCSAGTIQNYHDRVMKLILWSNKDVRELTSKDIRKYLYEYQELHNVSKSTLNGMRLVFSSFYNFLEEEDYIIKSPMRRIHRIRAEEVVRLPFTDEDLEQIRMATKCIRDLAIIDMLYSSGCRISELVQMDISDVDFRNREVVVRGKGSRDRVCYFNARTKLEVRDYLNTRLDKDPALFVTVRDPVKRISSGTVRAMLNKISDKTGIRGIHPHRFRRTLATNLLEKGMTLEQVKTVLGHKSIETTLIYTTINNDAVKQVHQKYTF